MRYDVSISFFSILEYYMILAHYLDPRGPLKHSSRLGRILMSTIDEKLTVQARTETIDTFQKSKFICRVSHTTTYEEAMAFLNEVKEPRASHNCWAYRGLSNVERFSDDGEPGGTAGRPILNAIRAENMYDVIVVTTRYFGGTKLGTGGLVRAYFTSAQNCLRASSRRKIVESKVVEISCPAQYVGLIYLNIGNIDGATKLGETFDNSSDYITVTANIPEVSITLLEKKLYDACKGDSRFQIIDEIL